MASHGEERPEPYAMSLGISPQVFLTKLTAYVLDRLLQIFKPRLQMVLLTFTSMLSTGPLLETPCDMMQIYW